jgi:hypothetical protein
MLLKLIAIGSLTLALSGCYQSVSIGDIKRGIYYCQSVDSELEAITSDVMGVETAICLNGKRKPNPTIPSV